MKRQAGDEATLLRLVLDRAVGMLRYYDLSLSYKIDLEDNSYTVEVNPGGLEPAGVLIRLQRSDELKAVLESIVSAQDPAETERAIQRGRCVLDSRSLRLVE